MKKYCVQILEVYRQDVLIEANNPEDALELVIDGNGELGELHYEYTLDDEWPVFEIK